MCGHLVNSGFYQSMERIAGTLQMPFPLCIPSFSAISVFVLYEFIRIFGELFLSLFSIRPTTAAKKDRSCRNQGVFSLLFVCCSQCQNKVFQNRRLTTASPTSRNLLSAFEKSQIKLRVTTRLF